MENTLLQLVFIFGIMFFVLLIILFLKKNALSLKYTLIWLFSAFVMFVTSVFPGTIRLVTEFLGFELLSNAVFSLLIGFGILIMLSLTSIISKQTEKIKQLAQVNALIEKRLRDLEEKEN